MKFYFDFDLLLNDHLFLAHKAERDKFRKFAFKLQGRLLDIGCGRKPYYRFAKNITKYIALDFSKSLLPDIVGNACQIPFKNEQFDSIIFSEVIEHLPEPEAGISEIRRVLKTSGILYLTATMSWPLHYEPHDYFRFTKYGIQHLMKKNGFDILAIEKISGFFTYAAVRLVDIFVLRVFFPLVSLLGIKRGKYRMAAILTLPASFFFYPIAKMLDMLDPADASGWAVLAVKR